MTQSVFNVTLPTLDNAGQALAVGQLTSVIIQVAQGTSPAADLTYPLPQPSQPGAVLAIPFSAVGFTPVGDATYTADAEAVDSGGTSVPSTSITWTQAVAPAAPTGFSVA